MRENNNSQINNSEDTPKKYVQDPKLNEIFNNIFKTIEELENIV